MSSLESDMIVIEQQMCSTVQYDTQVIIM